MKAALYARVSSEEQVEGYSIDAQRRAFQSHCKEKGWIPAHEYIEEGKSAWTDNVEKRPMFKQMIADALAGEFDVLVVHQVDRFSRQLRITLEYFEKLSKAGVGFVSVNQQIDYTTPEGRAFLGMSGIFAQFSSASKF